MSDTFFVLTSGSTADSVLRAVLGLYGIEIIAQPSPKGGVAHGLNFRKILAKIVD
jgi:hypothetical protein